MNESKFTYSEVPSSLKAVQAVLALHLLVFLFLLGILFRNEIEIPLTWIVHIGLVGGLAVFIALKQPSRPYFTSFYCVGFSALQLWKLSQISKFEVDPIYYGSYIFCWSILFIVPLLVFSEKKWYLSVNDT